MCSEGYRFGWSRMRVDWNELSFYKRLQAADSNIEIENRLNVFCNISEVIKVEAPNNSEIR